jgi:hypothetical protein
LLCASPLLGELLLAGQWAAPAGHALAIQRRDPTTIVPFA